MKPARCFFMLLLCLASLQGFNQEICNNSKDDDGDGLIDLRDPDCQCRFTVAGNLLQNGSFEAFTHCPTYIYDSDFNIITGWRFGTYTNLSEAIYYHNFGCVQDSGFVMTYIPPVRPLLGGKAFVAIQQSVYRKPNFKETDIAKTYISQCLQQPLQAGEQYTLSFYAGRFQSSDDVDFKYKTEAFAVAVFGHADCKAVPFGQPNVKSNGCPSNYPGWTLLGKAIVQSKGSWVQSHINFTAPPGINVVAIGPDCSLVNPNTELPDSTTRADFYTYYLDDLHLLRTKEFPFAYIQTISGDPCAGDSLLTAPDLAGVTYQWYKNGIALIGATQNAYRVPEHTTATYNVRIVAADTCFVTEPFFFQPDLLSGLHIPSDSFFCKGDVLTLAPSLNNVVYNWNGNMGAAVTVTAPGLYTIEAIGANGCAKTFTTTVQEQDCNSPVNMPNAFTPNGDGNNDVFRIPKSSFIRLNEFAVYDRWGRKVFSTKNKSVGWTGTNGNKLCPVGTYVYLIRGWLTNKAVEVKGTVTLIRKR